LSSQKDLRARARALHSRITSPGCEVSFLPTGGVFLTARVEPASQLDDEAVWRAYAQWHEAVHIAQLLTCPYLCLIAYRTATIALAAFDNSADGYGAGTRLSELKQDLEQVRSELEMRHDSGAYPLQIVETHALTKGLLWAMPGDAANLTSAANYLYKGYKQLGDLDIYLRVLNEMVEHVGDEAAIKLLPRLCFLALQTNEPVDLFAQLCKRVKSEREVDKVCAFSPREFCRWIGVKDIVLLSRSLRERPSPLGNHPWLRIFEPYFEAFESISDVDDRLNLLMGLRGGDTYAIFGPKVTVYENGEMISSVSDINHRFEEEWLQVTSDLVEGLKILASARRDDESG